MRAQRVINFRMQIHSRTVVVVAIFLSALKHGRGVSRGCDKVTSSYPCLSRKKENKNAYTYVAASFADANETAGAQRPEINLKFYSQSNDKSYDRVIP